MSAPNSPVDVYGVDFSGSTRPGTDIWIAKGSVTEHGELEITGLTSASDRFDKTGRTGILEEMRTWLGDEVDDAVVGLDFPFGFPEPATDPDEPTWRAFLEAFHEAFDDESIDAFPGRFGTEGRSRRDVDYRYAGQSPMSPQVQYQVFYGLRDLLWPLVDDDAVSVMPMADTGAVTTLIEVYPAATFGRLELYRTGYKGRTDAHERRRKENADGLLDLDGVESTIGTDGDAVIVDRCSASDDALDSVAALIATWRALTEGVNRELETPVEGYIYA